MQKDHLKLVNIGFAISYEHVFEHLPGITVSSTKNHLPLPTIPYLYLVAYLVVPSSNSRGTFIATDLPHRLDDIRTGQGDVHN